MSYLAVVFFKVGGIDSYLWPLKTFQDDHPASTAALEVLEEIDDDLDEQGIVFVKLDDEVESESWQYQLFSIPISSTQPFQWQHLIQNM